MMKQNSKMKQQNHIKIGFEMKKVAIHGY